tara:strand:- start:8165 stop:9340 length:1176 start_codon:yes stop_codon:yes gene_type:complete
MINKRGIGAFVNNSTTQIGTNSQLGVRVGNSNSPSTPTYHSIVGDVILDSNNPKFIEAGGYAGIGSVVLLDGGIARPLNPNIKTYPLPEETVLIFNLNFNYSPINSNSTVTYQPRLFYVSIIDFSSHPQYNATLGKFDSSQFIISKYFNNKTINPLQPYMGDTLFEGRFGSSIRLSSTNNFLDKFPNSWSNGTPIGDPIIIFRNGASPNNSPVRFLPVSEDINTDLSSIYQTTTQKINIELASQTFKSYPTPPIKAQEYTSPQIILNSDRIVLNSKSDSIIASALKSINLTTGESVNIDTKSLYIAASSIKLGGKDATESVLLGDRYLILFNLLLDELNNVMTVLKEEKIYPNGAPAPNALLNLVASNTKDQIIKIKNQLDSTKSKISKVL